MKKGKKDSELCVKAPELGPKHKEWREGSNISLEQASELSGLDVETLQRIENGEYCTTEEMLAYHQFFFAHIPNARELYLNFVDEILAKHGYTDD